MSLTLSRDDYNTIEGWVSFSDNYITINQNISQHIAITTAAIDYIENTKRFQKENLLLDWQYFKHYLNTLLEYIYKSISIYIIIDTIHYISYHHLSS